MARARLITPGRRSSAPPPHQNERGAAGKATRGRSCLGQRILGEARGVSGPSEAARQWPTTTNDDHSGGPERGPDQRKTQLTKIPDKTRGKKK